MDFERYEYEFEAKLVEVKGPNDTLMDRQTAWLAILRRYVYFGEARSEAGSLPSETAVCRMSGAPLSKCARAHATRLSSRALLN